tara:strand:+ start:1239 stop:2945 length:1707 start_codon:yes stop_codon:yes gene_type:complete
MSNSRDIADSAATINFIDTVTSNVQTQLDNKDSLPSQTGNSGEFLTTNGTVASWAAVDALPSQSGNAGKFLTTDGTNDSWGEVSSSPTFDVVASGALANGDKVIINANGTATVVTQTSGPPAVGSSTVYNSATTRNSQVAYDGAGKVVIAYKNDSNGYGYALVGSVSGTTISFGTAVVFNSATTSMKSNQAMTFCGTNKVAIAYTDGGGSNYLYCKVGVVSGTSISFGSAGMILNADPDNIVLIWDSYSSRLVCFFRYSTNSNQGCGAVGSIDVSNTPSFGNVGSNFTVFNAAVTLEIHATFDSNSNKTIVFYRDNGNSEYGTASVGTVSGMSISFAAEVVFQTSTSNFMSCAFDSSSNKVVVAYIDEGASNIGKCIVGTIASGQISFGTAVTFSSVYSAYQTAMTYDSVNNRIVIGYLRGNGSSINYESQFIAGEVSGTSISFATPVTFGTAHIQNISMAFDIASKASVAVYMNNGNSSYGSATVFQALTASTNLTSENFIGISNGAYANGDTATVQIVGSVDDAQTSLTAGQSYYVQGDNTLATTADDPSVFAGTAVSATKIIVKG